MRNRNRIIVNKVLRVEVLEDGVELRFGLGEVHLSKYAPQNVFLSWMTFIKGVIKYRNPMQRIRAATICNLLIYSVLHIIYTTIDTDIIRIRALNTL